MVTLIQEKRKRGTRPRRPLSTSIPEERLDVVHLADHKVECLGCGNENAQGRRFCEVCGRILTA